MWADMRPRMNSPTKSSPGYKLDRHEETRAGNLPAGDLDPPLAVIDPEELCVRMKVVQVRDQSGRLYSFFKTELSDYRQDTTRTPMPSFRTTLSDPEREDVVAYLLSLRGVR